MTKKLAIVGGGITKDMAPFDDLSWDIWTTASIGQGLPRVSMIWEIHTDAHIKPETKSVFDCPVMMQYKHEKVPTSEAWTPWALIEKYGPYFSCSMSFMLGEAFERGYKQVVTYGVDMMEEEYYLMREDFIYLVGFFRGKGMVIDISEGTSMLWGSKAYEYEKLDAKNKFMNDRLKYTERTLQEKLGEKERVTMEAEYVRGCRDVFAQVIRLSGG